WSCWTSTRSRRRWSACASRPEGGGRPRRSHNHYKSGDGMNGRDIIVVGASAGGIEALCRVAAGLPPGLPAVVLVGWHFPPGAGGVLQEILSRWAPLLARHARDGETPYPGHIYVAPPDYHLIVEPGVARLSRGPRENRFRPSIDPLFRTAARTYGPRVVGVI